MIPHEINRKHILEAIDRLRSRNIPSKSSSSKFILTYKGKSLPPKLVICEASEIATGRRLSPQEFSGGRETNAFLENLGFNVRRIDSGEASAKNEKRSSYSTPAQVSKHYTDVCNKGFTDWIKWSNRSSLQGMRYPGVYAIAISKRGIGEKSFSFRKEIVYFGMTNSKGGLNARLNQFEQTIQGKRGHGGAERFRFQHPSYENLVRHLYVSVNFIECDVTNPIPATYRLMGDVAKLEQECIAIYYEIFGEIPTFNKRSSRKKRPGSTIVLLSCSSQKLERRAKAKDLYTSNLFRKSLKYALKLQPTKVFILSAKYGLLDPETEIDPYDETLNDCNAEQRRSWSDKVLRQLERVADLKKDSFVFLTGEKYHQDLLNHITNAEMPLEHMGIGERLKFLGSETN